MADNLTIARSRATKHNEQSPLLKLPPEVRNKIYERVLSRGRKAVRGTNLHKPGLLQVCSQIREEANLMFYDLRNFHMFATVSNLDVMDSWTTLVSTAELKCIHRLSFQLDFGISEGGMDRVLNAIRRFSLLLWRLLENGLSRTAVRVYLKVCGAGSNRMAPNKFLGDIADFQEAIVVKLDR